MRTITELSLKGNEIPSSQAIEKKRNPEKLEEHTAWHGELTLGQASELLVNQTPFSYIFSKAPDGTLVMTYMNDRGIVNIATFVWEEVPQLWHYRNTTELSVATLDEMTWRVMHCTPHDCRPLSPLPVAAERV